MGGRARRSIARAAHDLIAKIAVVVPEHLRPVVTAPSTGLRPVPPGPGEGVNSTPLRRAIRQGRKLRLLYRAESGAETERVIWPVILGFSDTTRMLVAWCELRENFRHFRLDRILSMEEMGHSFGLPSAVLRRRW